MFRFTTKIRLFYSCLILAALPTSPAFGQELAASKEPVTLLADKVQYDKSRDIAIAQGHVEISQGARILRADRMLYDQKRNVVTAEGNVVMAEDTGQMTFADRAEVTSDLKQGFVSQLRILMVDNSRFAAHEAERLDGRYVVLRRGTYSPWDLCKEDPSRPPLWQMKASRITHDNEDRRITYRDAFLEVAGVPVFYTPYFSHPDPTVKRKTGFPTPHLGRNSNLGSYVSIPYYIDISRDKDLTLRPTISTKDGFQFAGEYRQRYQHGNLVMAGSAVVADRVNDDNVLEKTSVRGHLFGNMRFDMGRSFRAGTDIAFTSDKSYLYRYDIPTEDVLKNRAYIERLKGRNFWNAELLYFQDLRLGIRQAEPLAQRTSLNLKGKAGATLGGRWALDASAVSLTRDENLQNPMEQGSDSKRGSLAFGWERKDISSFGVVATTNIQARGDLFWSDRLQDPNNANNQFKDALTARYMPVASYTLSYPFARYGENWDAVIEPIAAISASPRRNIDEHIANEDSQSISFDHTNLFSENRFSGLDRYESGVRTTYGLKTSAYAHDGGRYQFMMGQSYRLNRETAYTGISGLQEKFSDIVGYVGADPASWLSASYGFQLNKDTFEPRRSEAQISAGMPWFRPYANYISFDSETTAGNTSTTSEITFGFTSNITDHWSVAAWQRRALKTDAGARNTGARIMYHDECTTVALTASRDNVSRPDLSPGTSILLNIMLRNLGSVQTDALSTSADERKVTHN